MLNCPSAQSNLIVVRIIFVRKIPSLALLEVGPGDSVWDVRLKFYGICPGLDHLKTPRRRSREDASSRALSHLVEWISSGRGFYFA